MIESENGTGTRTPRRYDKIRIGPRSAVFRDVMPALDSVLLSAYIGLILLTIRLCKGSII